MLVQELAESAPVHPRGMRRSTDVSPVGLQEFGQTVDFEASDHRHLAIAEGGWRSIAVSAQTNVGFVDQETVREDDRCLDHVLQFPDVAGPRMEEEPLAGGGGRV